MRRRSLKRDEDGKDDVELQAGVSAVATAQTSDSRAPLVGEEEQSRRGLADTLSN